MIWYADMDTVNSTGNDFQKSLKIIGNVVIY